MKIVVFAGLSISRSKASQLIQGEIVGPVKRGDISRFDYCDLFVIIDGEFGQSLSVSPKEILEVLDRGKSVIGASSMGALRASELDTFGMRGIGWVYERFKQTQVRFDDDVAMTYSPLDYSGITTAQVNVEYWTEQLVQGRLITNKQRSSICRGSRKIFFKDRTNDLVLEICRNVLSGPVLENCLSFTSGCITDIKGADAELAVLAASQL